MKFAIGLVILLAALAAVDVVFLDGEGVGQHEATLATY